MNSFRMFIIFLGVLSLSACANKVEPSDVVSTIDTHQAEATRISDQDLEPDGERLLSGLIVYVGVDDEIYLTDQQGANINRLTQVLQIEEDNDNFVFQHPAWSKDSGRLAFVGLKRTADRIQSASLFTVGVNGDQEPVEIYSSQEHTPFYLYWSPDSKLVSFLSTSNLETGLSLQSISGSGGEVQVLGTGQPFYWVWSPDSQSMLIHTGGAFRNNPDARLARLDLVTDLEIEELEYAPSHFQAPAWSPDGDRWLLAADLSQGQAALLLLEREGEIMDELAQIEGAVAFGWSPDGEKIAYLAGEGGVRDQATQRLTVVDPARLDRGLTLDQRPVIAFFWSPDSRKIAYFVLSLNFPSGEMAQVAPPSPDIRFELHILEVETGEAYRLVGFQPTLEFLSVMEFFDQYQYSATIWSPDSQQLVISAMNQDDQPGIYVLDASLTLEGNYLAGGKLAFWSWR